MYLTSSKGFRINADGRAQDNLKGLISLGVTCRFKDYDNEFHSGTTVEDLNLMLLECYQNGARELVSVSYKTIALLYEGAKCFILFSTKS